MLSKWTGASAGAALGTPSSGSSTPPPARVPHIVCRRAQLVQGGVDSVNFGHIGIVVVVIPVRQRKEKYAVKWGRKSENLSGQQPPWPAGLAHVSW